MAYPNDGDPIRLRILEEIRDRMAAITVANGFHTEVSQARIFDSQRIVLNGPMPFISVIPMADDAPRGQEYTCGTTRRQTVDIVGALSVQAQTGSDVWFRESSWLLSDMERAIFLDPQFIPPEGGRLAVSTDRIVSEVYDKGEENLALSQLRILVSYRHESDDPTK